MSNPLVDALGKGKSTAPSLDFETMPSRMLEVHHSEIPGLPGKYPGEKITVRLEGHISHPGATSSIMQVHHISPDSPTEESFGSKDAIRVIPPSSNIPS